MALPNWGGASGLSFLARADGEDEEGTITSGVLDSSRPKRRADTRSPKSLSRLSVWKHGDASKLGCRGMSIGDISMGENDIARALSGVGSWVGDGGAEDIDMVEANEMSRSEPIKSSVSSNLLGDCAGELGCDV